MTTTQTRLETVGRRVYFRDSPYSAKDQIKSLGAKWDADERAWWVGIGKVSLARKLVEELNATGESVMTPTEGSAQIAARVGLDADTPAGIVADKFEEEGGDARQAANVRAGKPAQQNPHEIRLTGKGRYRGREYYAGSITREGQKVRLLTLPDADGKYLDFWVACADVEQTKRYEPREVWDGRRYSGKTRTVYTTLGSIADFIAKQRRAEKTGTQRVQCNECGSWFNANEECRDCGGC